VTDPGAGGESADPPLTSPNPSRFPPSEGGSRDEFDSAGGWQVRRRWIPRLGSDTLWRRFRRRVHVVFQRVRRNADVADLGCADDLGEAIGVALLVVLALLILFFVALPLALALVDALILLLLALLAIPFRVLFRRPWLVDAHHSDGRALRWRVVGWRESARFATEARELLDAGIEPPGAEHLT
jgi:hypothetical protein